jgi:hypothetical protein
MLTTKELVLIPGFMTDKAMWMAFEDKMAAFRPIVHAAERISRRRLRPST